jgi:hypothetical protein
MRIFDLDNIVNIEQYGKLYDLFQNNYTYSKSDIEFTYVVEREMESRIDLICNKLYSNIDNIDFLLSYNKIDNPLNIMENDIIYYIDVFKIDQSKILNNLIDVNKIRVLNNNKSIILIDDWGLPYGGKGGKAVPWLTKNGWQIIEQGYQILLVKD